MTVDVRDRLTTLVQRVVEEAMAHPERATELSDWLLPPTSLPVLERWPAPSTAARRRAQHVVFQAVATIKALDPTIRGRLVYSELKELPTIGYSFKSCHTEDELALAPLLTHCLSKRAGHLIAVLVAYRFSPAIARRKTKHGQVDLFQPDVRALLARRANALLLVESNLWFLATLGDPDIVIPYAVRYDLARFLWDSKQPGHLCCIRCGAPVHYQRHTRSSEGRDGRCRHCSRGKPDSWPAHANEPHTRGTWWLRCQAEACTNTYIGRANQLRCPNCRLDTTTPARRTPLVP